MKSEVNLSDHYRRDLIAVLCKLSTYDNDEPFKDLTRTNILRFAIDKRFDKHLTGLRTAVANAFRLALTFYKRSKD
jgi:hypothetical protein